jgi:hypothetical protein
MDREWHQEATIHAVELRQDNTSNIFIYTLTEEKSTIFSNIIDNEDCSQVAPLTPAVWLRQLKHPLAGGGMSIPPHCEQSGAYLFEPGKALMKAAPYNLIASRFGICKLGKSTHYYIVDSAQKAEELKKYGKVFVIKEWLTLDKRNIKEVGKRYPKAEVTARNIPMDTDTLRKKLGVTSGDDAHIFGLKSDSEGNLLIIADRI